MNVGPPTPVGGPAARGRLAQERIEAWQRAGDILVVRLDNLGDLLMTTPAIAALAARPERRLTLLGSPSGVAAAGHLPDLDDAIAYDAPWVKSPRPGDALDAGADRRLVARLARRRFDAAVVFTVCTQSALAAALLLRLAGIPLRLAYARENPYALLSDWLPETDRIGPGMRHEVRRHLDLVAAAGFDHRFANGGGFDRSPLRFVPGPGDAALVRQRLATAGAPAGRPYLVVHPGSTAPSRRYPPERFGAAAVRIAAATGATIVLAGGPDDREACDAIARQLGGAAVSLAGRLGLGELAALIGGARLLVCNNSGPAHLAAAMRTPVVVAYALTNPQHTPWGVPCRVLSHEVPCRDCLKSVCPEVHHRCLLGVEVDTVVAAALDLWRETVATAGPASAAPPRVAARAATGAPAGPPRALSEPEARRSSGER